VVLHVRILLGRDDPIPSTPRNPPRLTRPRPGWEA